MTDKHIRTFNTITINGYKYKQYNQCNGTKHLGLLPVAYTI